MKGRFGFYSQALTSPKTLPSQSFLSKPLLLLTEGHHPLPGQSCTAAVCHSQVLSMSVCSAVELHCWKGVKGPKKKKFSQEALIAQT